MEKIRVGIIGYGNLGRGAHYAVTQNSDMELVCIFTRRNPSAVKTVLPAKVDLICNIENYKNAIDVMLMCGGSATDLPEQTPSVAQYFCTVDSFDTHAKIPEYFEKVNAVAKQSAMLSAVSIGWDPGLFSIARALFESITPIGTTYTFWGKGVSQGHSDALRRIKGVKNAIQYTVPIEQAMDNIRSGKPCDIDSKRRHIRECYVVLEDGANKSEIEEQIINMPNYFEGYKTVVHFISEQELAENHCSMPHGGVVMRSANSLNNNKSVMELSLNLESNPEFTASVLVAYARAVYKMHNQGVSGAVTVLDIPLSALSAVDIAELRAKLI